MDELLAIIGGSWQPLLLYPGLLSTAATTALMRRVWHRRAPVRDRGHGGWGGYARTIMSATCMFLLLALLPFPRSYWAYPIDLVAALALVELPYWFELVRLRGGGSRDPRSAAASRMIDLLNIYPLLALAVAALAQGAGSLLLPSVKEGTALLRWAGIVVWATTLPPLASLGPWHIPGMAGWLLDLRRVTHISLLVALALPAGDQWGYGATAIGMLAGLGSLTALHLLWRARPEPWERLQPFIALVLLALLLYTSSQQLLTRLR